MLPFGLNTAKRSIMVLLLGCFVPSLQAVIITEGHYQGRPHFIIQTQAITYFFDRAGGGFSRLIDNQARDWISFKKDPLESFPASAAAGFRGMPNSLFGDNNPDSGGGHPGFDRCFTHVVDSATLRTTTKTGRWQWTWRFTETTATMTMDKADEGTAWWFLYEGTIAGSFAPKQKYWGTSIDGPRRDVPDRANQVFDQIQWVYFGDINSPSTLFIVQHSADSTIDNLWYLGSSKKGSAKADDGMVIFGFGRGAQAQPKLLGAGQQFTVGLIEHTRPPVIDSSLHNQISRQVGTTIGSLKKHEATIEKSVHLIYRSVATSGQQSYGLLTKSKHSNASVLTLLAPHLTRLTKPQLTRFLTAVNRVGVTEDLLPALLFASHNRAYRYAHHVQKYLANYNW